MQFTAISMVSALTSHLNNCLRLLNKQLLVWNTLAPKRYVCLIQVIFSASWSEIISSNTQLM